MPVGNIKQQESRIRFAKIGLGLVKDFAIDTVKDLAEKDEAVNSIVIACTSHGINKNQLIELNIKYSKQFRSALEQYTSLKTISEQELRKKTPDDLKGILYSIANAIAHSGSKSFAEQLVALCGKKAVNGAIDLSVEKVIETIFSGDKKLIDELKEIYNASKMAKDINEVVQTTAFVIKNK